MALGSIIKALSSIASAVSNSAKNQNNSGGKKDTQNNTKKNNNSGNYNYNNKFYDDYTAKKNNSNVGGTTSFLDTLKSIASNATSGGNNNAGGSYTPTGNYFDRDVSSSDKALIEQYGRDYNAAKAAGDTRGMELAHANAEAVRAKYNYMGGDDGSEYIGIPIEEQIIVKPEYEFEEEDERPVYESKYDPMIDQLLDQYLNRDKFSYDVTKDPLYDQYKAQYLREGQRAMNDTLASAAAGAGGMNSYAVTAAQQANNYYNAQLGDKIPELYQMAYGMYLDDVEQQIKDLDIVQSMDNNQYARYRDTMADWRADKDFAYNKYRDEVGDYYTDRNFQYTAGRDDISDERYENEWDYAVGRDNIEDSRYDEETAYEQAMAFLEMGVMPSATDLQLAGITEEEAKAFINRVKAKEKKSTSSGGGSGNGNYKVNTGDVNPTGGGNSSNLVNNINNQYSNNAGGNIIESNGNGGYQINPNIDRASYLDLIIARALDDESMSDQQVKNFLLNLGISADDISRVSSYYLK